MTLQSLAGDGRFELRSVLTDMENLNAPTDVVICLQGSILDVSLNGRHTLIERGFDHRGTYLGCSRRAGRPAWKICGSRRLCEESGFVPCRQ